MKSSVSLDRSRVQRVVALVALIALICAALAPSSSAQDTEPDEQAPEAPANPAADGPVPATDPGQNGTAYDGTNGVPEVAAAQRAALAAPLSCVPGLAQVGLLQDNYPWLVGNSDIDPDQLGANSIELLAQGVRVCVLRSSDLDTVDMSGLVKIVLSSAQNQTFYDTAFPNGAIHPRLAAWVNDGGLLIANLADQASGPGNGGSWSGSTFFGSTLVRTFSNDNDIADFEHPIVTGSLPCLSFNCDAVVDIDGYNRFDIDGWGWSSHGTFQGMPADASAILSDGAGNPVMAEFEQGSGRVIVNSTTIEWRYLGGSGQQYVNNRKLLANLLSYLDPTGCENDKDCDGLSDTVEEGLGTSTFKADTDGDGLLDPWEVDPSVEGAGFRLLYPDGPVLDFTRDDLFGPYGTQCTFPDGNLRVTVPDNCFNIDPPDPLHVDIFFELDWQDCRQHGCPGDNPLVEVDPIHHAPNLIGTGEIWNLMRRAPIMNPDGERGINVHIVFDEAIEHTPNCDQDTAEKKGEFFGTPAQRERADWVQMALVKQRAVRYIWSGHSSAEPDGCGNPNPLKFAVGGYGLVNLEDYDWSPFGDTNLGGSDVLVTMGPLWSCAATVGERADGAPGPCYRYSLVPGPILVVGPDGSIMYVPIAPAPGIFPAKVNTGAGDLELRYPMSRLLGVGELDGMRQLWSRALTHLIGQSLGLSDADARNQPDVLARLYEGERMARGPDLFVAGRSDLTFGPGSVGQPIVAGSTPDYVVRAAFDADGDGVVEGEDNCPGLPNPDQSDINENGFGDRCDFDLDGDGIPDDDDPYVEFRRSAAPLEMVSANAIVPAVDPFPFDTDNDGVNNDADDDDDGDGIPDLADNCRLVPNDLQGDLDGDGIGDSCDDDADNDSWPNGLELLLQSSPVDVNSQPELIGLNELGFADTCGDGIDNDRDGTIDGADSGCSDRDGDGWPDPVDTCPDIADFGYDADLDGIADVCDDEPNGVASRVWVADRERLLQIDPPTDVLVHDIDVGFDVAALAADTADGSVWVYGAGTIGHYNTDGLLLYTGSIPGSTGNDQFAAMTSDGAGGVWLGQKKKLWQIAADGSVLQEVNLGADLLGLGSHPTSGAVWAATKDDVLRIEAGAITWTAGLAQSESGDAVAVSEQTTWYGVGNRVEAVTADGTSLWSATVGDAVVALQPAADGGVWVASKANVTLLDSSGQQAVSIDPFPEAGPPITAIGAGRNGTVWVAEPTRVAIVTDQGIASQPKSIERAGRSSRIDHVVEVGTSPAGSGADEFEILLVTPGSGELVPGATVEVRGVLSHAGTVEINGVSALVDQNLNFTIDVPVNGGGIELIVAVATSTQGATDTAEVVVVSDTSAPSTPSVGQLQISRIFDPSIGITVVTVTGPAGSVEAESLIVLENTTSQLGATEVALAAGDGSFSIRVPALSGDMVALIVIDTATNSSTPLVITVP